MCKKCLELKKKLRDSESVVYWQKKNIEILRDIADLAGENKRIWRDIAERGNNINGDNPHNDMGFIVGKESPEPPPKETPKPKSKKRIGTKTEINKFRALLDNPKDLWNDLSGLEGGPQ